jgi:hypothetical protein
VLSDRIERERLAAKAEAELDDAPLAAREHLQRPAHRLATKRLVRALDRVDRVAVRDQIAALAALAAVDPLVERDDVRRAPSASPTCRTATPVAEASSSAVGSRPSSLRSRRPA